jgi:hypothetical protein
MQKSQGRDLIRRCTNFCRQFLTRVNEDEFLSLFMSDESHFHLSGFVNKQNFCYWANETPPPPSPTASETITECKGFSVVCDIIFRDYWSLFLTGQ